MYVYAYIYVICCADLVNIYSIIHTDEAWNMEHGTMEHALKTIV